MFGVSVLERGADRLAERRKHCDDDANCDVRKHVGSVVQKGIHERGLSCRGIFAEENRTGEQVAEEAQSAADKNGEDEVALAFYKAAESDNAESNGVVNEHLNPMRHFGLLDILKEAVNNARHNAVFCAVAIGINHQRQHACKGYRAAVGH